MKKVLSMMLILAMILTMASFPAFAEEFERKLTWEDIESVSLQDANLEATISGLTGTRETLFDGNTTSEKGNGVVYYYADYNKVHAITINFEEVTDLSKLVIHWGNSAAEGTCQPAKKVEIYVGTKGAANANQELVYTYEEPTAPDGMMRTDTIDFSTLDVKTEDIGLIRIRAVLTSYEAKGRLAVREIEIYENSDGTDIPEIPDLTDAADIVGSNIRLESETLTAGLRFAASVSKAALGIEGDWAYDAEADYEFGMYLLPEDMLAEGETLTEYLANGEQDALKVVAKKFLSQTADAIEYTAVLTDIPEDDYERMIVAVPYVTAGEETAYYEERTDSYVSVAQKALDSYNDGNPNNLTEDQVKALKEILGLPIETTYTVNYVDAEGNPVADAKNGTGNVGDEVVENAVEVEGYTADKASETITLIDGENTITFTYTEITEPEGSETPAGERKLTWEDIESVSLQDVNLEATITGTRETLFDGNTTSEKGNGVVYKWNPATKVHAITINFNEVTDLSKLVIHWGNSAAEGTCQPAKKVEIYVGTKGAANADQELVYTYEEPTAPDGMMRTDTIDFSAMDIATEDICLIRIRAVVTSYEENGRLAVREIEVYENGAN